jgi:4-diphosphocytidyl-2-C-methyl-D-erythritol kinase
VSVALAPAKLNLALVVGPLRPDGKHEVATVLQRIELGDRIEVEPAPALTVEGFAEDTLVTGALEALAARAGVEPRWRVRITKEIPVAAGLGGGSSDAATALRLANGTLPEPLAPTDLARIAAGLGTDIPFFLTEGAQLAVEDGTELEPVDLPQDYAVVLVLPHGEAKESTAAVYAAFDKRGGHSGFDGRCADLRAALVRRDLAALPPNDLARSPLAAELHAAGAFRADVSGAGPAVYGLFADRDTAERAAAALGPGGRTWITRPAW